MPERTGVFVEDHIRRIKLNASPLFGNPNGFYDTVIIEVSAKTYACSAFHTWVSQELLTRLSSGALLTLLVKG